MEGQKCPQRATHMGVNNSKIDGEVNLGTGRVTNLGFRDGPS